MRPQLRKQSNRRVWLSGLGGIAFAFFLIKGLLWLLVPLGLGLWCAS